MTETGCIDPSRFALWCKTNLCKKKDLSVWQILHILFCTNLDFQTTSRPDHLSQATNKDLQWELTHGRVMFWGVYKLKEHCCVDIFDDEIRGTLDNFSDKVDPTPQWLIESKALPPVALRIICLLEPLSLNLRTWTPCQDRFSRSHTEPQLTHSRVWYPFPTSQKPVFFPLAKNLQATRLNIVFNRLDLQSDVDHSGPADLRDSVEHYVMLRHNPAPVTDYITKLQFQKQIKVNYIPSALQNCSWSLLDSLPCCSSLLISLKSGRKRRTRSFSVVLAGFGFQWERGLLPIVNGSTHI